MGGVPPSSEPRIENGGTAESQGGTIFGTTFGIEDRRLKMLPRHNSSIFGFEDEANLSNPKPGYPTSGAERGK